MSKNENLKYFPGKKNADAFKSKLSICSRRFFIVLTKIPIYTLEDLKPHL